jgi:hypothetical protein
VRAIRAFVGLAVGTGMDYRDRVLGGQSLVARLTSQSSVFLSFAGASRWGEHGYLNMGLRKECGYVGLEQSVRQAADTRFFELGHGNAAKEEGLCLTRAMD